MIDLGIYLNAVKEAEEEYQRITEEIETLLSSDSEMNRTKALAMRPALQAVRQRVRTTNEVYLEMREKASVINSGRMRRMVFDLLDPVARSAFIRQGGSLID